jgi:hypothetical protein
MVKEIDDVGQGGRMSKLKGKANGAGGAIKGWFAKTRDSLRTGFGKLKGRSRAES